MIAVRGVAMIEERALVAIFRAIIADNRAGGWRKLKRERAAQAWGRRPALGGPGSAGPARSS